MKIIVIAQVRNGAHFLPGFLKHLRDDVHGFIFVNDVSTDNTADLLAAESKVLEVVTRTKPHEPFALELENRAALIQSAIEHEADWILALDVDMRVEKRFFSRFKSILAFHDGATAFRLKVLDLWGDSTHFRADSHWIKKGSVCLFAARPFDQQLYLQKPALHSVWPPREQLVKKANTLDFILYHLGSMHPCCRSKRQEKFTQIDGGCFYNPLGYDYLTDATGLIRAGIKAERDFKRTPEDRALAHCPHTQLMRTVLT